MNKNLFWFYVMNAIIFACRGFEDLPSQNIFYYFKETLKYNQQTIMFIGSFISLAWVAKILIGYITDNLWFTKKQYIIGSITFSALIALFIGITNNICVPLLIGLMMLASTNSAFANVSIDGQMVETGKKNGITGALQSCQWSAITIASVLTGIGGGYLSEHFNYHFSYLCLLPMYLGVLLVTWQYKPETQIIQKQSFLPVIKSLFQDKQLLIVCLFLFLYNLSPSFGTPLMFIQRDSFHFSKIFIGFLGTLSAICSVIGAGLYWKYSKKIDLNKWIFYSVIIGATNTLCYLYYTRISCVVYDVVNSVIGMFLQLIILDFCARKSKTGSECLTFALLTSVCNLTNTCNGFIGGYLFPIIGLSWLIIVSSVTSFCCLPLLKRIKI